MKEFIYIFLGGGLGSALRYALHLLINGKETLQSFPFSTLVVNVLGSFLIGLFYGLSTRMNWSTEFRLFLTVGLCGGFTTFSTFSNESLHLLKSGLYTNFALYIIGSVAFGLLAAVAGIHICK